MHVRVWVVSLSGGPEAASSSLTSSLSPTERARARRYRHARDARRFSVTRGWLRDLLAAELGIAPAEVELTTGGGKPQLVGGGTTHFNVSHADDLAVIAIASRDVGIDVEPLVAGRRALEATAVACTPAEAARLGTLPPPERAEAFLRLWTAKEAYLKATGAGLAVAPDRVEIGANGRVGRWAVRPFAPAPGYVGAVAAEGDDWDVEVVHP